MFMFILLGFSVRIAWQCVGSILGLIGILLVIHTQGGVAWLAAAFVGAPQLAALINTMTFFSVSKPEIAPRWSDVSRADLRTISHTGILFLVLQIVGTISYSSDTLIVAQTMGAASVAVYAIPDKLFALVSQVNIMMLLPLWPAYGEALTRGDTLWVRKTLRRSLFTALVFSSLSVSILVIFGPKVIGLWIAHAIKVPFLLICAFAVWKVIEACGNAVAMFLNGALIVRAQVAIGIAIAISSISLKLFLINRIGLPGVPLGSAIAFLCCSAVPFYLIIRRRLFHSTASRLVDQRALEKA